MNLSKDWYEIAKDINNAQNIAKIYELLLTIDTDLNNEEIENKRIDVIAELLRLKEKEIVKKWIL